MLAAKSRSEEERLKIRLALNLLNPHIFGENDLAMYPFSAKMDTMIERNLKNELEENKIKLVENLLRSYIETFLEEEIRQETLIRNVGVFGHRLGI